MKKALSLVLTLALAFVPTVAAIAEAFAFEQANYQTLVKKSVTLKPVAQGIDEKLTYEWESSNPDIATVSKGKVKGVAVGESTITCTATGKSGKVYVAQCVVAVLQPITKITASQSKLELPSGAQFIPEVIVEPDDASIKDIEWTSSSNVVGIYPDGHMTTNHGGKATLTGKATDGSGKSVKITVTVPRVYVSSKDIVLSDPEGVELEYQYNLGSGIHMMGTRSTGDVFDIEYLESKETTGFSVNEIDVMRLIPVDAGKGSLAFLVNGQRLATVKITVEHSAVYDDVSCPLTTVESILQDKESFKGVNVSLVGTIADRTLDESGSWAGVVLVKNGDQYFSFRYDSAAALSAGEKLTVYGSVTSFVEYQTETGLTYECPLLEIKRLK